MRQSVLFTKQSKTSPKDEVSLNARLLIKAGFIDKLMAGVYTLLPLGLRVYKKVEQIIREEMNAIGGQELFMPTMHPKENWEATGRWESVTDLFRFTSYYSKTEIALGPTHEEVISPLVKKFIASYKDLPIAVYHIQNKFRDEKRAKSGLLRGREFIMKDLYSFHEDQDNLDKYYEKARGAYDKIFKRCGIGKETYLTYASGGTFSQYSHEFQTLAEAGEDIIYLCKNCGTAVNKEIIAEQKNKCPKCGNDKLKEEKAIEVGNIFKLGTKFSKPFNLTYKDKNGDEKLAVMGCYGIGLQRLMGTIVEVNNDENGLIWPESVAPHTIQLLYLNSDRAEVKKAADKVYTSLLSADLEVLYDDRDEISAGEKFADADLIGIPYRLVVSEKTIEKNSAEVKMRNSKKTELILLDDVVKYFKK